MSGFGPENAFDGFDYTTYVAAEGNSLTLTFTSLPGAADAAAVWIGPRSGGGTVEVHVDSGAGFVLVTSFALPDNEDYMAIGSFVSVSPIVGSSVRFDFLIDGNGDYDVRQLFIGPSLAFPIGQQSGVTPPNLLQGVVTTNVISVNGSLIGRNIRRVERRATIDLTLLDPAWVRTYWQPFAKAAARKPFWYRWDPTNYPNEVVFAAAEQIEPPSNMTPTPWMSVKMPLLCLAAREVL